MPPSTQFAVLLRAARLADPSLKRAASQTSITARPGASRWQRRLESSTSFERYGPAKDLLPPPDKPIATPPPSNQSESRAQTKKDAGSEPVKLEKVETSKVQDAVVLDAAEAHPSEPVVAVNLDPTSRPLEKVLQMPAPTASKKTIPHLEAPRYVHHFDTYTLVNDLKHGGFSQDQSITIMKAVRSLLAENLDLARESLVSISDVENESYLFKAACSELKTEIQSARRLNAEKMRSERALLQHEVDILSQNVTQETLNLKDELKGLFDDRKMAAKMEQRGTDSRIQEIHYKITSVMAGEAKGEVEGLRWYLTRMLVFTLAGTIFTGITYLSYSTRKAHKEQERQRKAEAESISSGTSTSTTYTVPARDSGTQTAPTDVLLAEAANDKGTGSGSGYVSLG